MVDSETENAGGTCCYLKQYIVIFILLILHVGK